MHRSFAQLMDEFNSSRLEYLEFAKRVKETTPVPASVLGQLREAYAAARAAGAECTQLSQGLRSADLARQRPDLVRLSKALLIALAAPDRSYTALLCQIAAEPAWLWGCQEMALEVLEDLQDPEAFAPLLELCCRRDLKMKDADWRKALDALAFSYGNRDPLQIEQALKAVIAAENDLKEYAIWCLDNRQKGGGNGVAA